jgi:hypothetical protein
MQLHAPNEGVFFENCFMVNADFSCIKSRTPLPSAGEWHHVAATYDGTAQYLYVDGVLMVTSPKPSGSVGLAFAPAPNINVGGNPWEYTQYNGYMDDVTFWARALTQSEVKDLAANPPR